MKMMAGVVRKSFQNKLQHDGVVQYVVNDSEREREKGGREREIEERERQRGRECITMCLGY